MLKCLNWLPISLRIQSKFFIMAQEALNVLSPQASLHSHHSLFTCLGQLFTLAKLMSVSGCCPSFSLNILSSTFLAFRSQLTCHLLFLREAFPVQLTRGTFSPVNLYHLFYSNYHNLQWSDYFLPAFFYIRALAALFYHVSPWTVPGK